MPDDFTDNEFWIEFPSTAALVKKSIKFVSAKSADRLTLPGLAAVASQMQLRLIAVAMSMNRLENFLKRSEVYTKTTVDLDRLAQNAIPLQKLVMHLMPAG